MDFCAFLRYFCVIFLSSTLAACGGGGGSTPSDDTPTANISLSESSYDFGGIVINNSLNRTFDITNTGTASLTIGDISLSDSAFSIFTDTCSEQTLAANETCSPTTSFSPATQGLFSGTLSIPSNDPDGTANIDLYGEGYGLNVWINKIEVDQDCNYTINVTVTDAETGEIIDLEQTDFTLIIGGQDVSQEIVVEEVEIPLPVSVALALDWSGSVTNVLDVVQEGANIFINQLINADDEAAICKFNAQIGIVPEGDPYFYKVSDTTNFAKLGEYINTNTFGNIGETKLYDAVYASIERVTYGDPALDKHAVVVMSDGHDNASVDNTLDDVIGYAVEQEIPVFTIYYVDPEYGGGNYGNPEILQDLAIDTGGQYYYGTTDDLSLVYQKIANILSSKYTITHNDTICTGTVSVEVEVEHNGLIGKASRTITL